MDKLKKIADKIFPLVNIVFIIYIYFNIKYIGIVFWLLWFSWSALMYVVEKRKNSKFRFFYVFLCSIILLINIVFFFITRNISNN